MRNNKKAMALLLAGMMAFGGCGDSKDTNASDIEAKDGLEATTDSVPDGTQGTDEAESQPEEEPQEQEWEEMIYNSEKLQIALARLEFDDEKDEGTAYLHLENKKEDGTIHIEQVQVSVDGTKGDISTDEGTVELSAGESRDISVRFSNPNAAPKLSESGAIELKMRIEGVGFDSWENGVGFYIKGDYDSIIKPVPVHFTVEEAEIYNGNGVSITVTGMNDNELSFNYSNNENPSASITYAEIYANDTLVMSNEPVDGNYYTGEGMVFFEETGERNFSIFLNEETTELIKEEPHEISIVFVIKVPNADYTETVILDKPQVTIPFILEQ